MKFEPWTMVMRMLAGPARPPPDDAQALQAKMAEISEYLNAHGLVTPPAPTPEPPAERKAPSWAQWAAEMAHDGQHPGWAYCKFGNRGVGENDGPERTVFVHGYIRSAFGVWEREFDVCSVSNPIGGELEDEHYNTAPRKLATITHLLSGIGLGVFASLALAMEAAELAEAIHPPWFTEPDATNEGYRRTGQAWAGASIVPAWDSHAHIPGSTEPNILPIYSRANILAGKPEKLS